LLRSFSTRQGHDEEQLELLDNTQSTGHELPSITYASLLLCGSTGADALGGDKCSSCKWAWGSGWILVALILLAYPFAVFRGYLAGSRVGKALSSFSAFWFSHHVLILVFTPLLVVHSIPAIPKGDTEGTSLTASKAWLFIGELLWGSLATRQLNLLPPPLATLQVLPAHCEQHISGLRQAQVQQVLTPHTQQGCMQAWSHLCHLY
jgi:hypothetical protein